MKEMVYKSDRLENPEVLAASEYKNHKYTVINYGTHPCCYVEIPDNIDVDDIRCHGGVTFEGPVPVGDDKYPCIGWDYAHLDDYASFNPKGRKYTTEELVNDCKSVIDQFN